MIGRFICVGGAMIRPIGAFRHEPWEVKHYGDFGNGFPCKTCGAIYATVHCPTPGQMALAKLLLRIKLRRLTLPASLS